MIQKIGTAMKKMAQRAMMRGNRGDALAINDHGIEGMRSNLQNQPQNVITQHPTGNIVSGVFVKETSDNVKANISNASVHHIKVKEEQPGKNLGSSITDALK